MGRGGGGGFLERGKEGGKEGRKGLKEERKEG